MDVFESVALRQGLVRDAQTLVRHDHRFVRAVAPGLKPVDPAFGHEVDALMVVDLAPARESMLRRYMGPDAAQTYLAKHAAAPMAASASIGAWA